MNLITDCVTDFDGLKTKAFEFIHEKHKGQLRKRTKVPYIVHCVKVARRIERSDLPGQDTIIAAFLHDTIEDTNTTHEEIKTLFNKQVADIVVEVTNQFTDKSMKRAERKAKEAASMANKSAMAKMVKCADRIDNLSDIQLMSTDFQKIYVQESKWLAEALRTVPDKALYDELIYSIRLAEAFLG